MQTNCLFSLLIFYEKDVPLILNLFFFKLTFKIKNIIFFCFVYKLHKQSKILEK